MNREKDKKDWLRLYRSITDPEEIRKQKRAEERRKRKEELKKDTGL